MRQLKNWDDKTWLSSKRYILHFNKFLNSQYKISKNTSIIDIGCGRANIISHLQKKYKFFKKAIGVDIIKNKDIKKNIIFKKTNIINYFKNTKNLFDLILIKQTIHFFSKKQIKILLKLAKKRLNKKGKILIFLINSKKNEIPCFDLMELNLNKSFKKDEYLLKLIKKYLPKNKMKKFSYKVKISRKNYMNMIKKRYISCLLSMSNKNLHKGLEQIKLKYNKNIAFNDKLICLIYKN